MAGWLSAEVISTLAAGVALLAAFVWWERSAAEPLASLRMFASRDFAFGNVTTFLMSGAIFAAGFLVTEEFQLGRGYSPVNAGLHFLPFFGTPMLVSPLAGALSDRIGLRPIMITGLMLLTVSFAWVAWRGSLGTSWVELVIALFIGGVGISMALPTAPTAVMSAVAPQEMGKASGINYMSQRFGRSSQSRSAPPSSPSSAASGRQAPSRPGSRRPCGLALPSPSSPRSPPRPCHRGRSRHRRQ